MRMKHAGQGWPHDDTWWCYWLGQNRIHCGAWHFLLFKQLMLIQHGSHDVPIMYPQHRSHGGDTMYPQHKSQGGHIMYPQHRSYGGHIIYPQHRLHGGHIIYPQATFCKACFYMGFSIENKVYIGTFCPKMNHWVLLQIFCFSVKIECYRKWVSLKFCLLFKTCFQRYCTHVSHIKLMTNL